MIWIVNLELVWINRTFTDVAEITPNEILPMRFQIHDFDWSANQSIVSQHEFETHLIGWIIFNELGFNRRVSITVTNVHFTIVSNNWIQNISYWLVIHVKDNFFFYDCRRGWFWRIDHVSLTIDNLFDNHFFVWFNFYVSFIEFIFFASELDGCGHVFIP